jgi:hypothetical protein
VRALQAQVIVKTAVSVNAALAASVSPQGKCAVAMDINTQVQFNSVVSVHVILHVIIGGPVGVGVVVHAPVTDNSLIFEFSGFIELVS